MPIVLGIFGIVVVAVAAWGFFYLSNNLAGGGGSSLTVPDSVRVGDAATATLELSVWGGGGPVAGRYTDVRLYYRLVGQPDYGVLQSSPVPKDYGGKFTGKYEVYTFTIPPYPTGTTGEIEYYYEAKLDGEQNHGTGAKKTKIVAAEPVGGSASSEVRFSGVIQAVSDQSAHDGPILIEVNGAWIAVGGILYPEAFPFGSTPGLFEKTESPQGIIGRRVEVYARKTTGDDNFGPGVNLTLAGSYDYYVRIAKP